MSRRSSRHWGSHLFPLKAQPLAETEILEVEYVLGILKIYFPRNQIIGSVARALIYQYEDLGHL